MGRNGPNSASKRTWKLNCTTPQRWVAAAPGGRTPMAHGGISEPYPAPNNAITEPGTAGFEGPFVHRAILIERSYLHGNANLRPWRKVRTRDSYHRVATTLPKRECTAIIR